MDLNEQLTQRLDSILKFLDDSAKSTVTFAQEQTPLLIQEYLKWYVAECYFFIALFSFMALLCIWASLHCRSLALKQPPNSHERENWQIPQTIALIAALGLLVLPVARNVYCLVKVNVAPRVVLLEKTMELVQARK